jgi:two-component system sensor histidine kinase PilS (NtrC family)
VNAQTPLLEADSVWRPLLYYCAYRIVLAVLLVVLVLWGVAPRELIFGHPLLFQSLAGGYLVFSLLVAVLVVRRSVRLDVLVPAQVLIDILAITLITHASGGLPGGFGLLLVITVAAGSILTAGRVAVLFAAFAAIAVLGQQAYVYLYEPLGEPQYAHAGLLGLSFFATTLVISASARRLRRSEALAARREVDLAQMARLNEHIIQRMQSGVMALDATGRVQLMNASAQRLLGLVDWQPGDRLDGLAPELARAWNSWLAQPDHPSQIVGHAASALRVVASFAAIGPGAQEGTVVFMEDAAAVNQRAQQLKLASLGRLAGSIAHEIRNPLAAISHAGQLLEESPSLGGGDHRLIHIIADNSKRMNAMVENVLELGRGRPATPEPTPLKSWLEGFLAEFTPSRPGASECIHCQVEPETLMVRVDRSQLHQIVWNLCDNALQHAGDPPQVKLVAGIGAHTGRPFLDVEDNGPGIAPEETDRVFEPFFTTRDQGTGLGLYISRELCEGNQANLSLERSDGGCRFRITFQDPRRRTLRLP